MTQHYANSRTPPLDAPTAIHVQDANSVVEARSNPSVSKLCCKVAIDGAAGQHLTSEIAPFCAIDFAWQQ